MLHNLTKVHKDIYALLLLTIYTNFLVPRWNLKNLSRGLNPPKPGLYEAPA